MPMALTAGEAKVVGVPPVTGTLTMCAPAQYTFTPSVVTMDGLDCPVASVLTKPLPMVALKTPPPPWVVQYAAEVSTAAANGAEVAVPGTVYGVPAPLVPLIDTFSSAVFEMFV